MRSLYPRTHPPPPPPALATPGDCVTYRTPQVQLTLTHSRVHAISCGISHVSAIIERQDGKRDLYGWCVRACVRGCVC